MHTTIKIRSLPIGLALFSMFFGAGNTVFPLIVGQYAKDQNSFAILGLLLTAAVLPMFGVIAMMLYQGDPKRFFGRIGKIPGMALACLIICLLGPLGSAPRCIALAYSTIKTTIPHLPVIGFSAVACGVIFLLSIGKNRMLTILGWILTPALLASLITIIALGFLTPDTVSHSAMSKTHLFMHGIQEGYHTMDLLAAFFFSSTILQLLQTGKQSARQTFRTMLFASLLGAFLLGLVYVGLSYLAALHGHHFSTHAADQLLPALTNHVAGPYAGILVGTAITLACLTSAIALLSAFSTFFQKQIFKEKVSYRTVLLIACMLTFFVSIFEFQTILRVLGPLIDLVYPGVIGLTFMNLIDRTASQKKTKAVVFFLFAISAFNYIWALIYTK